MTSGRSSAPGCLKNYNMEIKPKMRAAKELRRHDRFEAGVELFALARSFCTGDAHPPALDPEPAFGEQADGLRIGLAFLGEHPGRQRVGRVVVPNRHGSLEHDG